jgi:hypothetical protein
VKSGQIFLFSLNRGDGLNGRGGKETIGLDEIVSQFKPDEPKGMGGPVIIIEISIRIDEGGFQKITLYTFSTSFPTHAPKTTTQLYLDIGHFSRFLQNLLVEKNWNNGKNFFCKEIFPGPAPGKSLRFSYLCFSPQIK